MSRYIDVDLAINEIIKDMCGVPDIDEGLSTAISELRLMPTADVVEVKHGRWIKDRLCSTSGGTYGVRRCSVCEYYFQDLVNEYNFCPNCGSDMRERREE